jgi:phospholipase A-2-activating protein
MLKSNYNFVFYLKFATFSGKNFKQTEVLSNHTNFVSSVCVFNEKKWLATASNDKTINLYLFGIAQPFATLKDHTSTVCCLAQGLESKILVSASWDQTARIWNNLDINSASIELKGHEAAVWAITSIKNGKYATGSADKNIFVWNSRGEKLVVLKGHTDCVRGLVGLDDGSLLSCSNDATIRHWSETYDCLKEFHGHSNYIYSIALNPALGDVFVTGSEDSTIRMWSLSKGQLGDALSLPAQSVWTVACIDNGDIITGTSDALVRVFTKDPKRCASDDMLAAFETSVSTRKLEMSKELGGVKVNELPGPESLLQEGTDGQTRLVRQPNGKILCYQWTNGKWECVGDVMGAAGGTQETSGKSLHEGIEYDFVFNVDIEDGAPPLKLPFNKTDDPWLAAQKFIHKHDLPQVYLEQVANFIIKNANLTSLPAMKVDEDFVDPFTGKYTFIK